MQRVDSAQGLVQGSKWRETRAREHTHAIVLELRVALLPELLVRLSSVLVLVTIIFVFDEIVIS